ncbi:hypothetical protein [Altererythrobacter sp. MF3-039]|uniref:hypothetical protein n=1 Tax=Altererythrobacter sp. MF3-039 TaxID=3252901 RepID=UPI00390C77AF
MKALITAIAALGFAASPALAGEDAEPEMSKGEQKLAKILEGRVAGEPESCITTFGSGNLRIIDKTALVYERGKTVWVNYTRNPKSLDDDDYMVIRKYGSGSQLCRLDNVTTRDRGGNFFSGVIFLEDFVPYRKVEEAEG